MSNEELWLLFAVSFQLSGPVSPSVSKSAQSRWYDARCTWYDAGHHARLKSSLILFSYHLKIEFEDVVVSFENVHTSSNYRNNKALFNQNIC
jgi:hypothetical protein